MRRQYVSGILAREFDTYGTTDCYTHVLLVISHLDHLYGLDLDAGRGIEAFVDLELVE